jgi:predicted small lipoprotein YifL
MKSRIILAGALVLTATLGACGRQGDLERPRPIGAPAERAETERAPRSATAPALPDSATSGSQPARAVPIDGAGNDPRGGPGATPRP